MTENNDCQNVSSMANWIQEESEFCRPCVLAPIIQWYQSELEEHEHQDMTTRLQVAVDETDEGGVRICEELDKIKDEVDEELRTRLREFDCAIQTHAKDLLNAAPLEV